MTKQQEFVRLAAVAALLAATAMGARASGAPALPEQHGNGVAYVTGGIGRTEARAFERQFDRYPLAIEVVEKAGKIDGFTADADIAITDTAGHEVLRARADGPFLLAKLPAGRYEIRTTLDGRTLVKRAVRVAPGTTTRATFEFPANTDAQLPQHAQDAAGPAGHGA